MEWIELLGKVPLFMGLDARGREIIRRRARVREMAAATMVITEGEPGDSLYVILEGGVKIYLGNADGREVILAFQGAGDYFGDLALLDEDRRSASVMTTCASRFLVISRQVLLECMGYHPQLTLGMMAGLVRCIRRLTHTVRGLALDNVYRRVVDAIIDLAVRQGEFRVVDPCPSQQTIADLVGASREMVGRVLRYLADGDYVRFEGRRLIILRQPPADWRN